MFAYFVISSKLGTSYKSYPSFDLAYQAGSKAYRNEPDRVGKWYIEEAGELFCGICTTIHLGSEMCEFGICRLCGRFDDCGHDQEMFQHADDVSIVADSEALYSYQPEPL